MLNDQQLFEMRQKFETITIEQLDSQQVAEDTKSKIERDQSINRSNIKSRQSENRSMHRSRVDLSVYEKELSIEQKDKTDFDKLPKIHTGSSRVLTTENGLKPKEDDPQKMVLNLLNRMKE